VSKEDVKLEEKRRGGWRDLSSRQQSGLVVIFRIEGRKLRAEWKEVSSPEGGKAVAGREDDKR
jgi:hypothetical protein